MPINSPIPVRLQEESRKAAKILRSFVKPKNVDMDKVVPRSLLERAAGFAIFTVIKAGFVVSARAGSGVVIARLEDGSWSAPSAIGLGGFGFGGQMGAEVTDFLIVLNSRAAVTSFMSAGSLTLGGNLSVAVGPLGRNAEGSGALNSKGQVAAMYSYSKTKGLFGGVSVEGSVILERQDANRLAYGGNPGPTAKQILSGMVDVPEWADELVGELERCSVSRGVERYREDKGEQWDGRGEMPNQRSRGGGSRQYSFDDERDEHGESARQAEDRGGGRNRSGSGRFAMGRDRSASDRDENGRNDDSNGWNRSGSGTYAFGDGIGSDGKPPARPTETRKRTGSLFGEKSPPTASVARPGASKRTSSFGLNPFGAKETPRKTVPLPSSENYNAGLTWDSDGPMTGWGSRSRSGSNARRPELGSGRNSATGEDKREEVRGDQTPPREDDLLSGWDSPKKPNRSRGSSAGEKDLLGAWAAEANGLTASFSRLTAGRNRSNSKPTPLSKTIDNILEDDYTTHEPSSPFTMPKSGSPSSSSPNKTRNGPDRDRDRFDPYPETTRSPFTDEPSQTRPFDDYFPAPKSTRTPPKLPPRNVKSPGTQPVSEGYPRAIAIYPFPATASGDLGLKKGQMILILDSIGDGQWWMGKAADGSEGIFPNNYVEVVEIPKSLKGGVGRGALKARVVDAGFE